MSDIFSTYDPKNWHWKIGEETVFSSASSSFVAVVPEGAGWTNIASEQDLWDVLKEQAPECLPISQRRSAMPPLTSRQFRLILISAGLHESVNAAIANLPPQDKAVAEIEFEYSTHFERMHPFIVSLAAGMNISPEMIDAMWATALTL